jgi:hypothetical protein
MKHLKFSRLFAAFAFVAILALAGCKQPDEETHYAIEGTWVCDDGQKFIITNSTLTNYWGESEGYAGDNLTIVETSDNAGYIYIKYTRSLDYNSPTYYSENGEDVGKWYAVSYKSLTDTSVEIAGASNYTNGGVSSCDTLEEAKEEFTIEKGYFETHDTFVKQ